MPSEQGGAWPRTREGYCSCPYCTSIRNGTLPAPAGPRKRDWLERMGGRGESVAAAAQRERFAALEGD